MKTDSFSSELFKQLVIFLFGGFIYGAVEILFRGHTHPSMFVAGGLCLVWIGGLNRFFKRKFSLITQMLLGSVIITLAEFIFGLIVNVAFKLKVWDYSSLPFNIMGQVCPLFTGAWFMLSLPAVLVEELIRCGMFLEKSSYIPHKKAV